jgi:hypothetical protein
MNHFNLQQAHSIYRSSFYQAYLLTKRNNILINNITSPTLTSTIISSTQLQTTPTNQANYTHLRQHYDYLQTRHRLYDGIINLRQNSIIATPPPKSNGVPWFGKVLKINDDTVDVLWFHKHNDSTYYYLNDTPVKLQKISIICNGIEFEPVYDSTLHW